MPHGMDPTDYRAFYPYTPNEVKHRKRTTSAQLKVLEGIFKRDTKPNAALRTELASQLNMTARGVQVWFQNRRAKEKTKAAKGALKKDTDSPSPRSSEDPDDSSPGEHQLPGLSTSESPSPTATDPPPASCRDRLGSVVLAGVACGGDARGRAVRSPLAPHGPEPQRLPAHKRSFLWWQRAPRRPAGSPGKTPPTHTLASPAPRTWQLSVYLGMVAGTSTCPDQACPTRATAPFPQHTRHASMDGRSGYRIPPSPSPSPLSPYHAVRASLPDHNLYPVSSRPLAAPIPGPLPSPGFSFGVANASSDGDRNSPVDFGGFSFPPTSDADTEGDDSSASYQMSRFGSIASESSATSAYFSDVGSTGEAPDFRISGRRESCPTGFLNLMSGLDVGVGGPRRASLAEGLLGNYSSQSLDGSDRDAHGVVGYPSPSSTISPGDSPRNGNSGAPGSELNYALHQPHSADANTFFFDSSSSTPSNSSNGDNNYPHSAPATSDEFGAEKFNYDYNMPYSHEGTFNSDSVAYNDGAEGGYGHGGMDFTPSEQQQQQQQPYYESHPQGDTAFTYS
ncbi:hypothetical protein MVEN_00521100 [Mycena venus]|uniref:Homeobox domain-containing protein n=1 Tax=Mycena venus TaxID=2733690 RepID=A0A8H6YMK1_9AGAR|nr:hypothetical protein MVEN_00521100 [Mycena venus]